MEIFRPEIHSFFIRPLLDGTQAELGRPRVDAILEGLGTSREALEDPTAWVSLEFVETLLARIDVERHDPVFLDRMFRAAISPRYLGPIYPLLRSFGTPAFTYVQVTRGTARFNKIGRYEVAERSPRHVRLVYRPLPGAPVEQSPLICAGRRSQFAAVPTLFDLPPATVEDVTCMARGDEACTYDIHWREPARRIPSRLGVLLGLAAGGLFAFGTGLGGILAALAVMTPAVCGWALGRVFELRADLGQRIHEITEHHDALSRITIDNEKRYEELLSAKAEVEERVRQRTAELRETSEQLAETLAQVQKLDRAKTDFFANVSHELRTPLTLILGPLDDLAHGRTPPGGEEAALRAMHRNGTRLLELINQLLDLAKIDAGGVELDRHPVDLPKLAESIMEGFRPSADRRSVALVLEYEGEIPPFPLDRSWVESALTNLLANALRFSPEGSQLTVRLADRGDRLTVEVVDEGRGMSEEDQARIFDRFAQGASDARSGKGTGLGLAIVREAARLHGGEASVRSTEGEGTAFTLELPRVFSGERDGRVERTVAEPEGPFSSTPPETRLSEPEGAATAVREGPEGAPVALVAEDNADLRDYIADILSTRYRVYTAQDGEEALALALEHAPQVVVTDVSMPRRDGFSLTRALRERDETRTVPVVLVTARRATSDVLQGFEAGANDYVPKPFHASELLARVEVHVRLRQMVREMAHRERLATLGVVAASVAHQVRNPLTVLLSGLPAMQRRLTGKVDDSTTEMLKVMVGCASRIERMTLDLLDLSRVDRAERGPLHPGEGLEAAVRLVRSAIPETVTVESEVDTEAVLEGRAGDLNHVFLNLVDNAGRAVSRDGSVRILGKREGDDYVVSVEDSGPGIPEGDRSRIFEPFFSTRAAGEGTGLGLAIAKQVVEQHGGSIELGVSDLGGARFVVRLGLLRPDATVVESDMTSLPGLPAERR